MMHKHNIFMKLTWGKAALLIAGSVFGQSATANHPVVNIPVNQSDYEPLHQGRIQVNATLFNAPCNLSLDNTLIFTGCGAGRNYREMNLFDAIANTPVSVRFYDTQYGVSSERYPLSLLNGDNPIYLPTSMRDRHALRIEVSYE